MAVARLDAAIRRVLAEYPSASGGALYGHPLTLFITNDLPNAVRAHVPSSYKVRGSAGQFNTWSQVPFVAVFDRTVTVSAQRGYYVCYLFRQDGRSVFLSLNQGTTEVQDEYKARYRDVLQSRADFGRVLLQSVSAGLIAGPLDLGGTSALSRGYEAGNILAKEYTTSALPSQAEMIKDLEDFLDLYSFYKAAYLGDIGIVGDDPAGEDLTGVETKKLRWHQRAERDRKLAQKAKEHHGYRCQVCDLDFVEEYGSRGDKYIEAHHLVPFADLLTSPEPAVLDVRTDFAVVCANCHRMLHRKPMLDLVGLRELRALAKASHRRGPAG